MTEHDDTQPTTPIPRPGDDPRAYRYPGAGAGAPAPGEDRVDVGHTPEATRAYPGGFTFSPAAEPATAGAAASAAGGPTRSPDRRRGRGIGVLVGALILGGGAGFGGAAAYDALNDDASPTSTSATSTRTSNTASVAPAEALGSVQEVAERVLPSVVMINVSGPQGRGSGSGIVLSEDGEILTNDHVVEVAASGGSITVAFDDGSTAPAEIVGTDPLTDTAVIRAEGVSGLTPAEIGSSGALRVGEQVVAIGSPFGLEATVTSGIVSALDRPVSAGSDDQRLSSTYPAIQTDAAINPGNSGGPLVNMAGQVVGINSSIRSVGTSISGEAGSIGLGFAIPMDKVQPIVEQLRAGETATHARLGVSVGNATDDAGSSIGASVESVEDGTAAADAGLRQGDVITRVDDTLITGSEALVATIRGYRPGDEVELTLRRDGEEETLTVTLGSDEGLTGQPTQPAEPGQQEQPDEGQPRERDLPPWFQDFFGD